MAQARASVCVATRCVGDPHGSDTCLSVCGHTVCRRSSWLRHVPQCVWPHGVSEILMAQAHASVWPHGVSDTLMAQARASVCVATRRVGDLPLDV